MNSKQESLEEIITEALQAFDTESYYTYLPEVTKALKRHIKAKLQAYCNKQVIEELENMKTWNGSVIGINGKRVDNVVHHSVIDNRIEELGDE